MGNQNVVILENLRKSIFGYNNNLDLESAKKAVEVGIDPLEALDVMTVAVREIGDAFGRGEFWLPDLIGASDAMQSAVPALEEEIRKRGQSRETL